MRTPEQNANKYLQRVIKDQWILQRHEDRLCTGIPDFSFVSPYGSGWVEMKATTGDRKIGIRKRQIHWLCDRSKFDHFRGFILCRCLGSPEHEWLAALVSPEDRATLLAGVKPSSWRNLSCVRTSDDLTDILPWMTSV